MNIQIRHFDRILLMNLDGPVTEADLVQTAGYINTLATKIACVVFDVHLAQIEAPVAKTLLRLKVEYEKNKIRFLLVSPQLAGADSATLADAVDSINTSESARLTEIFAQDAELRQARQELAKLKAELMARLGLKETPEQPLPKDEITRAIYALEEKNKQLQQLFKTLSSEIHRIQGKSENLSVPGADNPEAVRVAEVKRRALDGVKGAGILD